MTRMETPCKRCEPQECSHNLRRRANLTSELKTPGGCAHYYLGKILPDLPAYVKSLNLPTSAPRTTAPKGWETFIGTAFDHCLRSEYAPDQPDEIVRDGLRSLLFMDGLEDALEGLESKDPGERDHWASILAEEGRMATRDVMKGMESEIPEERALWSAIAVKQSRTPSGEQEYRSLVSGGSKLKQELMDDIRRLMEIARDNLVLNRPEFGTTFGISSF
jgi:hypothetical protein